MLFAINRDSEKTPEVPSVGAFYANFLLDLQDLQPKQPKEKQKGIAKTQTWQQQKAIFLRLAHEAAAIHQAEQKRLRK
jgi:hypothetical protein